MDQNQNIDEIVQLLKAVDVPCAKMPSFDEVCADPQLLSRNMIMEVDQPLSVKLESTGLYIQSFEDAGNLDHAAPDLGENNEEYIRSSRLQRSGIEQSTQ